MEHSSGDSLADVCERNFENSDVPNLKVFEEVCRAALERRMIITIAIVRSWRLAITATPLQRRRGHFIRYCCGGRVV